MKEKWQIKKRFMFAANDSPNEFLKTSLSFKDYLSETFSPAHHELAV